MKRQVRASKPGSDDSFFWSPEKDEELRRLRDKERLPWTKIADELGRSADSCKTRYYRNREPVEKPLQWDDAASGELLKLKEEELYSWDEIEERLNRSVDACKYRYDAIRTKKPRGPMWTEQQDQLLSSRTAGYGNHEPKNYWTKVAAGVPGQSAVACRLRYVELLSPQNADQRAESSLTQEVNMHRDGEEDINDMLPSTTAEPFGSRMVTSGQDSVLPHDTCGRTDLENRSELDLLDEDELWREGKVFEGASPPLSMDSIFCFDETDAYNSLGFPVLDDADYPPEDMFRTPASETTSGQDIAAQISRSHDAVGDERKHRLRLMTSAQPPDTEPQILASTRTKGSTSSRD